MPFIGYDLISFNYGLREDFLDHLISSNGLENQKDELITDDYLESLDRILNKLSSGIFDYREFLEWSIFDDYYSSDKIDWYRTSHEPINLIQWFNNGSAITVNFDKMYELLNNSRKTEIATPKDKLVINHFLRGDSSVESLVFKVHGDLYSGKKEMVLSKNEFQEAYNDPEFIAKLNQWICHYILFFVGIDIRKDEYLKLIIEKTRQEGIIHIAIVGCSDEQQAKEELLNDYAAMHIMPLIYDISKPDSVRVLLHKLLVDCQNTKWKKSFARGVLHYLYNDQKTVGREEQLVGLKNFIGAPNQFLFCKISGQSIVGKSKLAFEFAQTYATNWRWYMISAAEMSNFLHTQSILLPKLGKREDTLIIFDDYHLFEGSLDEILDFIHKIDRYCLKIRFIFISNNLSDSNFKKEMSTDTYKFFYSKENIYKNFLLKIYSIDELMDIALSYVLFRKKELKLSDNKKAIDDWMSGIQKPLRQYISEIVTENPHEALIFSMVYAVKLTLNYLNDSTPESDAEYVYNEVLNYEMTESKDAESIHVEKVDKRKLFQNKKLRIDRIEIQYEKIRRNTKNTTNENRSIFTSDEEFRNKFNFFGKGGEDE